MKTQRRATTPSSSDLALTSRSALARLRPQSEEDIHRAVVRHLEARCMPGCAWWHTPNGDIRHKGAAGRLKALGTKAGMPDLMLLRDGQLYGLELKREGGRTSPSQTIQIERLTAAGAITAVAYGLDAALTALKQWGCIR